MLGTQPAWTVFSKKKERLPWPQKTCLTLEGKWEKFKLGAPPALGKIKNTMSCQHPAAEPPLLISIRAAITTFPSLRGCIASPPLGGVVGGVTSSFSPFARARLPPRHLCFTELLTRARNDPSQRLKGRATLLARFVGSLWAPRHCSRCAGLFPFPFYSLWLRSLTTSGSSSCSLGPLQASRRTVWT